MFFWNAPRQRSCYYHVQCKKKNKKNVWRALEMMLLDESSTGERLILYKYVQCNVVDIFSVVAREA